jgi:predicted nucleic acid-binding protein
VLFSARNGEDHEKIRQRRSLAYLTVPFTEEILQRAIDVQGELAKTGRHRIPIPDLLIAATGEAAGLTVLHYDGDYDLIASITGQPVEWVVPRGSL